MLPLGILTNFVDLILCAGHPGCSEYEFGSTTNMPCPEGSNLTALPIPSSSCVLCILLSGLSLNPVLGEGVRLVSHRMA